MTWPRQRTGHPPWSGEWWRCHAQTNAAKERLAKALDEILRRNAVGMHVDAGILVDVAAIGDLIRVRQARGSPEDRGAVAVLRVIGEGA